MGEWAGPVKVFTWILQIKDWKAKLRVKKNICKDRTNLILGENSLNLFLLKIRIVSFKEFEKVKVKEFFGYNIDPLVSSMYLMS